MERWMAARPWENRVFDSTSVSKDVFDGYSVRSPDMDQTAQEKQPAHGDPRLNNKQASYRNQSVAPPQTRMSLRISPESYSRNGTTPYANGQYRTPSPMQRTSAPITPPSAYKTVIRSASPRASIIRREDIEEAGSQVSKATTRYGTRQSHAGSVRSRDDESLASSPSVPNYMQATQSAKAKVRSHSTPKQRPGTPEKEHAWASKRRFSLPISHENMIGISGPVVQQRPSRYAAQRSPSLRADQRSVSSMGSRQGDVTPPTSEARTALYR